MNTGGFGTQQTAFNFGTSQPQPTTSIFGQQQQQPAFGGFGTSQPQTSFQLPTTAFGTTNTGQLPFGTGTAASNPFGAPAQTFGTQPTTGFGAPAFGIPAASTSGFAAPTQFGAAPSTGFGAPASTGFGAPASSNTFGIGTTPAFGTAASAPSVFPTSSAPSAFGSTTALGFPSSNVFGTTTTQPFGSQPFNFATSTTSSTFGSIPAPNFTFATGNQPAGIPPLQQQAQIDPTNAFYQSIFQCNKFGDERDMILANFNYLQASLGIGKGYYSQTLPPVIYTPTNPLYKFKAIGFSFMYPNNNEDGLVSFEIKKSAEKVRGEETMLVSKLQAFLNRQNVIFKIAGVKATSEEQSIVNIYAEDQTSLRRFPATDLAAVLNQTHLKPQLDTMGITNVSAKVRPSPEQLKRYLENAPDGIDPRVWKQAQEDNPNPETMVPAPVIGIDALKKRIHAQEMESAHHEARLLMIREECGQYMQQCANVGAEVIQLKRKQSELSLRLLSVITKLEVARRGVSPLQPEEQELSRKIQSIDEELNSPTEYKGRLMELLSHLRLQQVSGPSAKYTIDESSLHEIKELLVTQQKSLKHLVETVKSDMSNVAMIVDNGQNLPQTKNPHLDPFQSGIGGKEQ